MKSKNSSESVILDFARKDCKPKNGKCMIYINLYLIYSLNIVPTSFLIHNSLNMLYFFQNEKQELLVFLCYIVLLI